MAVVRLSVKAQAKAPRVPRPMPFHTHTSIGSWHHNPRLPLRLAISQEFGSLSECMPFCPNPPHFWQVPLLSIYTA